MKSGNAAHQGDIIRARKLPNGDVCFITNQGVNGTYTRMEPKTQKTIKSFNVTGVQVLFGSMEVLPNGNIIVPHYQQQRVVEYNQDGAQVATFNLNWPNSVVRLPNGNTLVASQNTRQIVEFDTNRNQIATHTCDGMVFVARRRRQYRRPFTRPRLCLGPHCPEASPRVRRCE